MINARAETIAEKPAFRHALRQRRCLVVADGFYEWAKTPTGRKQPFFITVADNRPFAFAGLWESWSGPDGERIESCTIIVTQANEMLRPIHGRMPAILDGDHFDSWLDTKAPLAEVKALLRPFPGRSVQVAAALARADRIRRPRSLPARHPPPLNTLIGLRKRRLQGDHHPPPIPLHIPS
jgi:putative SOS response-associated peptidase YedK